MLYRDLTLPTLPDRPFFYTNFVETADGKVQVQKDSRAYWPLGSAHDYATLVELRAHADVMLHGKNTASWVRTLDNLAKSDFQLRRRELGKTRPFLYVIVSGHPDASLLPFVEHVPTGVELLLLTTEEAHIPPALVDVPLYRCGKQEVDVAAFAAYLHQASYGQVLVEGGPALLGSFVAAHLLDELFLTLASRLIGSEAGNTITLIENVLFAPEQTPRLKLLSHEAVEDELYLRYSVHYGSQSPTN